MNSAQISEIKGLEEQLYNLQQRHDIEREALRSKLLELYKTCNHTYENGQSAIEETHFMRVCLLCNWSDL